jgi:predicted amidophosphoribosyltransferase
MSVLRNCPQCGRLLTTPPGMPCAACLEEEDTAVERILEYLAGGGPPTVAQVARQTGLRPALLRRLAQRGRIALHDGDGRMATCDVCGRPVGEPHSRICHDCVVRMAGRDGDRRAAVAAPAPAELRRPRRGFYSREDGRNA